MEIDITKFFNEAAPRDYSASQMEFGPQAGQITWGHALEDAPNYNLLDTEEKVEAFRKDLIDMGFEREEIDRSTAQEINAMFLQEISAAMREAGFDDGNLDGELDWEAYEEGANAGRYSGRIFKGDDGIIYFYVGA